MGETPFWSEEKFKRRKKKKKEKKKDKLSKLGSLVWLLSHMTPESNIGSVHVQSWQRLQDSKIRPSLT